LPEDQLAIPLLAMSFFMMIPITCT